MHDRVAKRPSSLIRCLYSTLAYDGTIRPIRLHGTNIGSEMCVIPKNAVGSYSYGSQNLP